MLAGKCLSQNREEYKNKEQERNITNCNTTNPNNRNYTEFVASYDELNNNTCSWAHTQ